MTKKCFNQIKEGLEELRDMLRSDPKSIAEIAHEQMTDEQKANLRSVYRTYRDNKRRAALQERGRG